MILQFVYGMGLREFQEDPKTIAAVERKILLISEAAARLGDEAERPCPGLPWRNIRGIGDWLRHRYDRVDVEMGWNTVVDDLPPLIAAVLYALNAASPGYRGHARPCVLHGRRASDTLRPRFNLRYSRLLDFRDAHFWPASAGTAAGRALRSQVPHPFDTRDNMREFSALNLGG